MNKYNLKTFDRRILNFNITYPVTKSRMKVATIPPPTQLSPTNFALFSHGSVRLSFCKIGCHDFEKITTSYVT